MYRSRDGNIRSSYLLDSLAIILWFRRCFIFIQMIILQIQITIRSCIFFVQLYHRSLDIKTWQPHLGISSWVGFFFKVIILDIDIYEGKKLRVLRDCQFCQFLIYISNRLFTRLSVQYHILSNKKLRRKYPKFDRKIILKIRLCNIIMYS